MQYKYRGSVLCDGTIVSARDVGNMAAELVAGRNGLSWTQPRMGFDTFQTAQQGIFSFLKNDPSLETKVSVGAQREGYELGKQLQRQDNAAPNSENRP